MKIAAQSIQKTKRILGIDPGTNVLGYAVISSSGSKRKVLTVGVHRTPKQATHPEKLSSIFSAITALIEEFEPTECALESPFFGKNVQSMLKLGRAQGVAMAAAISKGLTVVEYAPKKIKMSVTGSGNASKEQVADMACSILGYNKKGLPLDATDALATGICHLNQNTAVGRSKKYNNWKSFLDQNPDKQLK